MGKAKHPIFSKTITGLLLSFVLSGFLLIRANKHKQDFDHVEGVIEYIEKTSPLYPNKNPDKYRFLKVDTYNKPFELFVGKASGDFKPKLEIATANNAENAISTAPNSRELIPLGL